MNKNNFVDFPINKRHFLIDLYFYLISLNIKMSSIFIFKKKYYLYYLILIINGFNDQINQLTQH